MIYIIWICSGIWNLAQNKNNRFTKKKNKENVGVGDFQHIFIKYSK